MNINKSFKRTLTAMTVTAVFSTTVLAAQIDVTEQIRGRAPVLEAVAAQGTLKAGKQLSLPDNYVTAFADPKEAVSDLDGDAPLSLKELNELAINPTTEVGLENAKIEWFIVPSTYKETTGDIKADWLTKEQFDAIDPAIKDEIKFFNGTDLPQDFTGKQTITIPAIAVGKRIGFKVSVRTETGFPADGEPKYVMNAFISDGGENGPGPTDPIIDPNTPPGTVDLGPSYVIIETREPNQNGIDDWVTVIDQTAPAKNMTAEKIHAISKVGQQFRAHLVNEDGISIDHLYKNEAAFNWKFRANAGMIYDGKPITQEQLASVENSIKFNNYAFDKEGVGTGDFFYLTLQNTNEDSQILPLLEQGLILSVNVEDSQVDLNEPNPIQDVAPLIAPVVEQ